MKLSYLGWQGKIKKFKIFKTALKLNKTKYFFKKKYFNGYITQSIPNL